MARSLHAHVVSPVNPIDDIVGVTTMPVGQWQGVAQIRVLVVIDHAILAEAVQERLDMCPDITVVGVFGAIATALLELDVRRPDVVVIAHQLADGDGVAAAVDIKRADPATRAVILTTSEDDERFIRRAFEGGCSGWVGKARSSDDLCAAVRSAHAGEVLMSTSQFAQLVPRKASKANGVGTNLSPREHEVLVAMAEGGSDRQIATQLSVSHNTARKHTQNIIRKLGAHSKLEAVVTAMRNGVIPPL
jgi:DNA-binding NarL/FixJ family response regulator